MTRKSRDLELDIKRCARRAAWLIRKHGWHRGSGGRGPRGERCAMMAIWDAAIHVVGDDRDRVNHIAMVTRFRAEALIDPRGRWLYGCRRKKYLAYWNDKTGQTVGNAIAILQRVSNGERTQEAKP